MTKQNTDVKSLAHTKWNCKYHVVFAPKYRRKVFYNEKREDIRDIIRTLCQWKGVEIIRRRNMSGPYTFVAKYTTKDERFRIYGISQGKKFIDDISEVWKYEICI